MSVRLIQGDCRVVLPTLAAESVHCCVTSPPYWGLRDYGVPSSIWNGAAVCEHEWGSAMIEHATNHTDKRRWQHTYNGREEEQPPEKRVAWLRTEINQGQWCQACGAWRGSLGLEPTPELYVEHMVAVFREVRRVLRDDGTLWLNLGDNYASGNRATPNGLKSKDLVGIPWRVAFALQADGWWLRQDIIWSKPNPMPESVHDRCTKAHEYLFLLAKSKRYYFDAQAIQEPFTTDPKENYPTRARVTGRGEQKYPGHQQDKSGGYPPRSYKGSTSLGRNKRSVWTIATQPYVGAHFATFPPKLVEPCILSGCPEGGTVLDPFAGSGTVAQVATQHRRRAILIDLNPQYLDMVVARTSNVQIELPAVTP